MWRSKAERGKQKRDTENWEGMGREQKIEPVLVKGSYVIY